MNPMTYRLVILAFCIAASYIHDARGSELSAGPMVGVTAQRSARIWFQTSTPSMATVEFWAEAAPKSKRRSSLVKTTANSQHAATVPITDLKPGTRYSYRILLDGKPASPVFAFATQMLWQWRTDPPDFRVATGSCAYVNEPDFDRPGTPYGAGEEIFDRMAATKPDLTVWLGDNLYFREVDFDSPWGLEARYAHTRQSLPLQKLLQTGSHAAIWDDHDYGPNDGNSSFFLKDKSLELFKNYWPNPGFGSAEMPGVSTIVRHGDAEFFLVDGRWYRDSDRDVSPSKSLFGTVQLRWLKNALLNSTATFKIITSGSPMLDTQPHEGWQNFPNERQEFIDWLTANKVDGVMFLSGDRHSTELLQWPRNGTYPLFELICSPLTAGPRDISKLVDKPGIVSGTLVGERNFCILDFQGPRTSRTLDIRSFAADGREFWKQTLSSSSMRTPRPPKTFEIK